eukprot:SAG25_NODE_496_length_7401_cov_8.698439_2_plen_173_part_00
MLCQWLAGSCVVVLRGSNYRSTTATARSEMRCGARGRARTYADMVAHAARVDAGGTPAGAVLVAADSLGRFRGWISRGFQDGTDPPLPIPGTPSMAARGWLLGLGHYPRRTDQDWTFFRRGALAWLGLNSLNTQANKHPWCGESQFFIYHIKREAHVRMVRRSATWGSAGQI